MIWLLTIILTIIIIWSCISAIILSMTTDYDFGILSIDLKGNGLLVTISQLYWLGIGVLIFIGVIGIISYAISKKIICDAKNNDYPGCGVVETTNEKGE